LVQLRQLEKSIQLLPGTSRTESGDQGGSSHARTVAAPDRRGNVRFRSADRR
jgi:hypothetical protein